MSQHITRVGNDGDREWLIEFDFDGNRWCLPGLYAGSREEAEKKLRAAGANGVVLGDVQTAFTVRFQFHSAVIFLLIGAVAGAFLARWLWGGP